MYILHHHCLNLCPFLSVPDNVDMFGVSGLYSDNHHGVQLRASCQLLTLSVQHCPAQAGVDNDTVIQHYQSFHSLLSITTTIFPIFVQNKIICYQEGTLLHFVFICQVVHNDDLTIVGVGSCIPVAWTYV